MKITLSLTEGGPFSEKNHLMLTACDKEGYCFLLVSLVPSKKWYLESSYDKQMSLQRDDNLRMVVE